MSDSELCVSDGIKGGFEEAVSRLYFYPGLETALSNSNLLKWERVSLAEGHSLNWSVEGAAPSLEATTYHPEFGVAQPNLCLHMRFIEPRCIVRLSWN
jgi:hypothetical protein